MDNRAETSVIMRILPEPHDVLEGARCKLRRHSE
jgi:hypothetical protein